MQSYKEFTYVWLCMVICKYQQGYTFGENFDFDTFKNVTFQNDTFESV